MKGFAFLYHGNDIFVISDKSRKSKASLEKPLDYKRYGESPSAAEKGHHKLVNK